MTRRCLTTRRPSPRALLPLSPAGSAKAGTGANETRRRNIIEGMAQISYGSQVAWRKLSPEERGPFRERARAALEKKEALEEEEARKAAGDSS